MLIHVEVQGHVEAGFAQRMYVYHYRLFDRYGVDVVSLAVLADENPGFRPMGYRRERWGCEVIFSFPTAKLLDWEARWSDLEASANVFALVVMAHLRAKTSRDGRQRQGWKFHLVRLLYNRGYDREQILELFRLIDWMIRLPEGLEREFLQRVYELEEALKMPYITSAERVGVEKGRQEGRQEGLQQGEAKSLLTFLEARFGPIDETLRARVSAMDMATLEILIERAAKADSLEAVFGDRLDH